MRRLSLPSTGCTSSPGPRSTTNQSMRPSSSATCAPPCFCRRCTEPVRCDAVLWGLQTSANTPPGRRQGGWQIWALQQMSGLHACAHLGEHHGQVGDGRVGDPGLLALQQVRLAVAPRGGGPKPQTKFSYLNPKSRTLANTTARSATGALVIQAFSPSSRYASPSRRAVAAPNPGLNPNT